jgi:hypothetical protein
MAIPGHTFYANSGDVSAETTKPFNKRDAYSTPRSSECRSKTSGTRTNNQDIGFVNDINFTSGFNDRS